VLRIAGRVRDEPSAAGRDVKRGSALHITARERLRRAEAVRTGVAHETRDTRLSRAPRAIVCDTATRRALP
jgi:hypothetical protein